MHRVLIAVTVIAVLGITACRDKPAAMDHGLSKDLAQATSSDTTDTTGLALAQSRGRVQQVTSAIEQVRAKPAVHTQAPRVQQKTYNVGMPHISVTSEGSTPEPASAQQMTSLQRGPADVSPLSSTQGQGRIKIRISQETSPGAGDFDSNVLGVVWALNTNETAAAVYEYGLLGPNYGNSVPKLTANTSHLFFVNTPDGLTLFVVHNTTNHPAISSRGSAKTRFDVLDGTARVLLSDDRGEATANRDGTSFTGNHSWSRENTDGMVIGPLLLSSTIIGQFTKRPTGLDKGWEVISVDGSTVPLHLVPGRRVRLDFIQ